MTGDIWGYSAGDIQSGKVSPGQVESAIDAHMARKGLGPDGEPLEGGSYPSSRLQAELNAAGSGCLIACTALVLALAWIVTLFL